MASHRTRPVHGPMPKSLIPASLKANIGRNGELFKGDPIISPSIAQRRENTKRASHSPSVKRSKSSSSIGTTMDELDAEGSGDRRRNRLGYHRTSVACGQYPSIHLKHQRYQGRRKHELTNPQATVGEGRSDAYSHQMILKDDALTAFDCDGNVDFSRLINSLRLEMGIVEPRARLSRVKPLWNPHRFIQAQWLSMLRATPIFSLTRSRPDRITAP